MEVLDRAGTYKKPEWRDDFGPVLKVFANKLSKCVLSAVTQKKEIPPKITPAAEQWPKQWCHKPEVRLSEVSVQKLYCCVMDDLHLIKKWWWKKWFAVKRTKWFNKWMQSMCSHTW